MRVGAWAMLLAIASLAIPLAVPLPAIAGTQSASGDYAPGPAAVPDFDPAALTIAKLDRAQLARVDRMLAATRFGAGYDNLIRLGTRLPPPPDASPELVQEHAVRQRIAALVPWSGVADLWRAGFAKALPADVLDAVSAFHESDVGRLLGDCVGLAQDLSAMNACQDADDQSHGIAYRAFRVSSEGRAFERAGNALVEPLMTYAMRRALAQDAEAMAALVWLCARRPGDSLCMALPSPSGASR